MVGYINAAGGKAIGLSGKDGNMVIARKLTRTVVDPDSHIEKVMDLGLVGEPDKVDVTVLTQILGRELIPVLAPVAAAANGGTFNVNADTFAGAIAGALKAKRLLLLTDVPGVLDKSKNLIKQLSADDARRLIADGTISGGMIPRSKPALKRWSAVSRVWSFSTARCRTPCCSNCSPNSAPARSFTINARIAAALRRSGFLPPLTARSVAAQRGLYQSRLSEMSHHCGRGGAAWIFGQASRTF
jgi:hypothetical protein